MFICPPLVTPAVPPPPSEAGRGFAHHGVAAEKGNVPAGEEKEQGQRDAPHPAASQSTHRVLKRYLSHRIHSRNTAQ